MNRNPLTEDRWNSEKKGQPLSIREAEVLDLLAQGFSQKEVGQRLRISPATVKNHATNIFRKLDAKNVPHAVYLVYRCRHSEN